MKHYNKIRAEFSVVNEYHIDLYLSAYEVGELLRALNCIIYTLDEPERIRKLKEVIETIEAERIERRNQINNFTARIRNEKAVGNVRTN